MNSENLSNAFYLRDVETLASSGNAEYVLKSRILAKDYAMKATKEFKHWELLANYFQSHSVQIFESQNVYCKAIAFAVDGQIVQGLTLLANETSIESVALRACLCLFFNRLDLASKDVMYLKQNGDDAVVVHIIEALNALQSGDVREALYIYEELSQSHRHSSLPWLSNAIGACKMLLRDSSAIESFDAAKSLGDSDAFVNSLIFELVAGKKWEEMESLFFSLKHSVVDDLKVKSEEFDAMVERMMI